MKKALAVLGSALALGLVAAGCGSDNEPVRDKPAPSSSGGGGGGAAKSTAQVALKQVQFQPASVTVKKGGTVKWTNDDSFGHDVTKKGGPGPKFSSGEPGGMQGGDTFQQKFDTPGTVQYVCTVHANMKGSITVK